MVTVHARRGLETPTKDARAPVPQLIQNYKAPVASEDVAAIVEYLTRTKGVE